MPEGEEMDGREDAETGLEDEADDKVNNNSVAEAKLALLASKKKTKTYLKVPAQCINCGAKMPITVPT